MDVMSKYRDEFFKERKDLLNTNHVYRNHITKFSKYLELSKVQLSNYPKDWNAKYEEDINKCINKSIAQNDYYCYV